MVNSRGTEERRVRPVGPGLSKGGLPEKQVPAQGVCWREADKRNQLGLPKTSAEACLEPADSTRPAENGMGMPKTSVFER